MKNRICKRVINALTVVALILAIPVVDGSNIITYIFQNETVLAKTAKQKKKEAEKARLEQEAEDEWLSTISSFKVEPIKRKGKRKTSIFECLNLKS